ncbi:hypothetical protein VTL71DRAFT_14822 [Oculimacula yallundae]|uniref:Maleylacetoacetate isomerase n=1 Tax=Oculimacula yallundae TaxID=86028 RepID=A0ABR4CKV7_9HELO
MAFSTNPQVKLYTYYRSSCSARLRIALALKNLPREDVHVNLIANQHQQHAYTAINPSGTVPTLFITNGDQTTIITQSIAALEYLDEGFPKTYQLLPKDASARATVRTLVGIIACDVQPPTNLRILNRVKKLAVVAGDDPAVASQAWARELMAEGLRAYEAVCKETAGIYSVGDEVSMADVCLVPAMWGAERFGVDLRELPTILRVYGALKGLEEVKAAHWQAQSDCPVDLR